ncbi:MAG: dihydrolipoyllysine-residue acetyltransferase [Hydrogenovibrio sp.]|uniref:dihydrolipoyllysine-residue acetyltransferase n=1 Tax=Hydrogenovibrio sp. TaxID=2065821 RepID=UPI0028709F5B|nr:dihydrolipoyllysine-residue acetyltransferase [Hydrogenovibrio sp.]MDR9497921.1 dihydrolipoyllysine-residue acetyltransferase [Hydrogenovibrio sp.]
MATQDITIPDIGDFDSVEVIEVLIAEGDEVAVDDSLITLESDKATMEIPAPASGRIESLTVKVGDKVAEGDVIGQMSADEASDNDAADTSDAPDSAAEPPQKEAAPSKAETPAEAPSPAASTPATTSVDQAAQVARKPVNAQSMGAKSHASPSVRAFARKLGVDLGQVTGTGPKGRVVQPDVEGFIKSAMQGQSAGATGAGIPPVPEVDFSQFGETTTEELGRIKKLSGKFLQTSWLNVPHVTQFDETDITDMDAFRKDMKPQAEKAGVKLTPLVFVMKAVVKALQDFPSFNASLSADGQSVIKKHYYNIGVAVDTPNGLVVPVVRDVDQKGIFELSEELMTLSTKARDGKLSPKDMSGGCFSISSLGGIGGTQFTPIVNAPEVAIMGLSKAKMQPVWNGSEFEPRLIMPFSVSYDHRAIDGAEGVRFTTTVGQYLSDLRQLIL